MVKMTEAQCYELGERYLWVWRDYHGEWQARAGRVGREKRCSRPLQCWSGVEVFLQDFARAFEAQEVHEQADDMRRLARAVRNGMVARVQPLQEALTPWDGLKSWPFFVASADDGSEVHLYLDGSIWRLLEGSELTTVASSRDPASLLTYAISQGDAPVELLQELRRAIENEEGQVGAPEGVPVAQTRPLPTNLVERFGALVADLVAEGGARADLGRRILCLAADDDQACPENAGGDGLPQAFKEGLLQALEAAARDAFKGWQQRWDPLRPPPQVGPMDAHPEWGWQEVGRPEVWWGESSDDAEGAALAESARTGRPHRLVRAVAQTERAPRGHWRSRALGGAE